MDWAVIYIGVEFWRKIRAEKNQIYSSVFKLKSWNSNVLFQVFQKAGAGKRLNPQGFIGENERVRENKKAVT